MTFGAAASRSLFAALLLIAYAAAPVLAIDERSPWLALPLLTLPLALALWRDFVRTAPGPVWNALLFRTVKLELAYGVLLAAGALVAAPH